MIVPTVGPAGADIMLLGEAPGSDEDATGLPFQGYAGRTLNNLLQQAGISRHSCLIANVARERPPGNNISLYFQDKQCTTPRQELATWIQQLKDEIAFHRPNIIIALGRTALWALTGETSISQMRGYLIETNFEPKTKVLPTFHPQAVNYDYKLHFTVIMDLRKALRHSITRETQPDLRRLHSSPSYQEFMQYIAHVRNENLTIAVDIETCQPGSHIHIMGIADSPNSAYSFEILRGHAPIYSPEMEARLWLELSKTLHDCKTVMHNGSYDAAVLMHLNGIYCKNFFFDTMIAAHVCWPETPRSLGYCSSLCLDVLPWKHTAQSLPCLYNAADAANTYGIYEVLKAEIERQGLQSVFEFEMSTIEPAIMLQLQGLYVNPEKRKEIKEKAETRIAELEGELETALGKKINFSSPKQLQSLLYIDLGLPVQYKRRKCATDERKITADAEALKKLNQKVSNPVLDKIMELKKLTKLTTGFLNVETSPSSRVHTCYNVTGATMARENKGFTVDDEDSYKSFGRWSSSKSIILPYGSGNLQNIPKKARKMYTAPEGYVFLQADYMQAEAVVVAYLINDVTLKKLFQDSYGKPKSYLEERGMDVHKLTAAMMFNVKPPDVTPQQRTIGKTLRHACVDSETEVLTETGWKKIPSFNKHLDKVAQWSPDGAIEFVTPTETVCYEYNDLMLSFTSKNSIDQLVSPGHRMPNFKRKGIDCTVTPSEVLFLSGNGDITLPLNGIRVDSRCLSIPAHFAQLVMAFQADGSIRERGNKRELNFYLKKTRKQIRLRELLTANGVEFSESFATGGRTLFYISYEKNKDLFNFIKATNKRLGSWVLNLSQQALSAAVEESKWWDSRRNNSGSWQYYSVIRENCEWLATMAHLCGYKATVSDSHPTVFTTNIVKQDRTYLSKTERKLVKYSGYIYSMQVPSTFYMVRRNGKISITGNTNYSAGPSVLANRLDCSVNEAKQLLRLYHAGCPQLQLWHGRIQDELKRTRTLYNLFGRKHYFLERWSDTLFRSAYSYIPQSTVGDLMNKALVNLYTLHGSEIDIVLQLHDAIYCLVPSNNISHYATLIKQAMTIPLTHKQETFFIDVDFAVGPSWGDQEPYDIHAEASNFDILQ